MVGPVPPDVIDQLIALRNKIGTDPAHHEYESIEGCPEPVVINRSIPALDYAVARLRLLA